MCVCMHAATLESTIVYGRATEIGGRPVHVLGYQNLAHNRARGANAMLLPIPAAAPMGPANALDMREHPELLDRYRVALRHVFPLPRSGGRSFSANASAPAVQVFEAGSYTVVLARGASVEAITAALAEVPEAKRPALNLELLDHYLRWYPGWSLALCCFDAAATKAEPMVWVYEPLDPEHVFLPGLDGHDGGVPNLRWFSRVDHTVLLGLDDPLVVDGEPSDKGGHPGWRGGQPRWTRLELPDLPAAMRPLFPARVCGSPDIMGELDNGDWYLPARPSVEALAHALRHRRPPPGA